MHRYSDPQGQSESPGGRDVDLGGSLGVFLPSRGAGRGPGTGHRCENQAKV